MPMSAIVVFFLLSFQSVAAVIPLRADHSGTLDTLGKNGQFKQDNPYKNEGEIKRDFSRLFNSNGDRNVWVVKKSDRVPQPLELTSYVLVYNYPRCSKTRFSCLAAKKRSWLQGLTGSKADEVLVVDKVYRVGGDGNGRGGHCFFTSDTGVGRDVLDKLQRCLEDRAMSDCLPESGLDQNEKDCYQYQAREDFLLGQFKAWLKGMVDDSSIDIVAFRIMNALRAGPLSTLIMDKFVSSENPMSPMSLWSVPKVGSRQSILDVSQVGDDKLYVTTYAALSDSKGRKVIGVIKYISSNLLEVVAEGNRPHEELFTYFVTDLSLEGSCSPATADDLVLEMLKADCMAGALQEESTMVTS